MKTYIKYLYVLWFRKSLRDRAYRRSVYEDVIKQYQWILDNRDKHYFHNCICNLISFRNDTGLGYRGVMKFFPELNALDPNGLDGPCVIWYHTQTKEGLESRIKVLERATRLTKPLFFWEVKNPFNSKDRYL